jgi:hypothetical protein
LDIYPTACQPDHHMASGAAHVQHQHACTARLETEPLRPGQQRLLKLVFWLTWLTWIPSFVVAGMQIDWACHASACSQPAPPHLHHHHTRLPSHWCHRCRRQSRRHRRYLPLWHQYHQHHVQRGSRRHRRHQQAVRPYHHPRHLTASGMGSNYRQGCGSFAHMAHTCGLPAMTRAPKDTGGAGCMCSCNVYTHHCVSYQAAGDVAK